VEDLPDIVANASALLSAQPESISSRISTQAYDFFTQQPCKSADVYLLRMIIHDWPSHMATTILKNQLDALKANPRARLIIMDTVLPTPGSTSSVEEALLRVRDLTMIQAFNSKEREVGEFIDLFSQASDQDGCLILKKIIKPPGSVMSLMEVIYQPFCR
jgi:6-hydroxytryprostatin B O-methyltransferase